MCFENCYKCFKKGFFQVEDFSESDFDDSIASDFSDEGIQVIKGKEAKALKRTLAAAKASEPASKKTPMTNGKGAKKTGDDKQKNAKKKALGLWFFYPLWSLNIFMRHRRGRN